MHFFKLRIPQIIIEFAILIVIIIDSNYLILQTVMLITLHISCPALALRSPFYALFHSTELTP